MIFNIPNQEQDTLLSLLVNPSATFKVFLYLELVCFLTSKFLGSVFILILVF